MNANETMQKSLLKKKIVEYFSLNPKTRSVIIKTDLLGKGMTSWKVVREGDRFNVTEVATTKSKFIIEAPVGGQLPAAGSQVAALGQPQNSVQAKQANIQQFAQLDLPTKLAQMSTRNDAKL